MFRPNLSDRPNWDFRSGGNSLCRIRIQDRLDSVDKAVVHGESCPPLFTLHCMGACKEDPRSKKTTLFLNDENGVTAIDFLRRRSICVQDRVTPEKRYYRRLHWVRIHQTGRYVCGKLWLKPHFPHRSQWLILPRVGSRHNFLQ